MIGPSTPTIAAVLILAGAVAATGQPLLPSKPSDPPSTVPLILDAPATLEGLLERLRSPDFVLLRGDRYRDLLKARGAEAGDAPVVDSVAIRGRIDGRTAELEAEFRVTSRSAGPDWVAIRLDGIVLTSALEGGQAIPVRAVAGGAWEAEVHGVGQHILRVAFATRVHASVEERRLDVPIPLAGSNTLGLDILEGATEASLGGSESLEVIKRSGGSEARIDAVLKPRGRLDIRWKVTSEPGTSPPPLLGVQGDIAVDITTDAIRTRSRWSITSARGTATSLTLSFDAAEDLLELDLDGRGITVEGRAHGSSTSVVIPLSEPLRPGGSGRSVTLVTRRKIDTRKSSRVTVRGGSIEGSITGGGALSVSQSGPIWVESESGRGLQRIDPANDLPSDLRSRPGTILAYRIVERSFELGLRIEPSLPLVTARASTAIHLKPGASSVETRLDVHATPGRLFELHFPLGDEILLEPLAEDDVVASWNVSPSSGGRPRLLDIRLTAKSTASGVFTLTFKTLQRWASGGGVVRNALIWPSEVVGLGGRVSVSRTPDVEAQLEEGTSQDAEGSRFTRVAAATRDDWPWPIDQGGDLDAATLWGAYDGRPSFLPLRVSVRTPSYRWETDLVAELSRGGIAYRQAVRLSVIGGRIDDLELLVPAEVDRGWSIDGIEIAGRRPIESYPDGSSRYRVTLARKGANRVNFELRFATPFEPRLGDDERRVGRFTRIRLLPGPDGPLRLGWTTRPGMSLAVDARGWQERISGAFPTDDFPAPGVLYRPDASEPMPSFEAAAKPLLSMPELVVSRCFLRTVRGSDEMRTTAIFRIDAHGPSAAVTLPKGARWIQAMLDGVEMREVERTEDPDGYRCHFAQGSRKGFQLLAIDYASPVPVAGPWQPPSLLGAVNLSTYWEVVVPGSQAVLGTPSGWSDENRWQWMGYVWMRTPRRSDQELNEWVAGTSPSMEEPRSGRSGQHAYLFRKEASSAAMSVAIAPRSVMLMVCSGAVALVGIGLVLMRPAARGYAALAVALMTLIAAAWDPDLTLQAIPSGILGLPLTACAAALQWGVNRRRAATSGRFAGAMASASVIPSSTGPAVGSEDSTAIRARPPTVSDRIVLSPEGPAGPLPSISETGMRP